MIPNDLMTDGDLVAWRAKREAKHHALAKPSVARKPKPAVNLDILPDPVLNTIRRIDGAAELVAPVLTDAVLLQLIERVLAAGRMEWCGCLEAMAADTVGHSAFERQFFMALRDFIKLRATERTAVACIGCYPERCPGGKQTGGQE